MSGITPAIVHALAEAGHPLQRRASSHDVTRAGIRNGMTPAQVEKALADAGMAYSPEENERIGNAVAKYNDAVPDTKDSTPLQSRATQHDVTRAGLRNGMSPDQVEKALGDSGMQ